jgi:hypothetical protein
VRTDAQYPYHNQEIRSPEESLALLRAVLEREQGDARIIVVNNRAGYAFGDRYLDSISTLGPFLVEHRENIGGAFGAYDHAFQKYRDQFQHWLFTEDDIVILHPYQRFVDRYEKEWSSPNPEALPPCGFLAIAGFCDRPPAHAHGGVGLSSRDVLERICEQNGGHLPHPRSSGWQRRDIELDGEVAFGQAFIRAGYSIVPYGDNLRWHADNGCLPYFNYSLVTAH